MEKKFIDEVKSWFKSKSDNTEKSLNYSPFDDKRISWGLIVLLAGAAYALFMLIRSFWYFFG